MKKTEPKTMDGYIRVSVVMTRSGRGRGVAG